MNGLTIRRWLLLIVITLGLVLLTGQLLFQRYFINYVSGIYRANVEMVIDSITGEIHGTFNDMNQAVSTIAESYYVLDYARTAVTGERYTKAFEQVRPIVQGSMQGMDFDHLLVSDITSAWYRFDTGSNLGSLSQSAGRQIMRTFQELPANTTETTNAVMTLDGITYFCTVRPLFITRPTAPEPVVKAGLVAALMDINKTREQLNNFDALQNIYICLHDGEKVLISNTREWENQPLAELLADPTPVYRRNMSVLSGSLSLLVSIPEAQMFPRRTSFAISLLMAGAFSLLLLLLMGLFVNRLIVKPFSRVIAESAALGGAPVSGGLSKTGVPDVDRLVTSINEMVARIDEYAQRDKHAQQNLYEMQLDQQKTQMYLLRNQIDRHFLFNSLISIKTLAERGEIENVEEVAKGIAQLMFYTTSRVREVNFFDEMEIARRYVNIQNIRFGNYVTVEIDVDDRLCQYKTLKLLIQPLVENAFVHGLEPGRESSVLYLRGALYDDYISIEVEDNGGGIPPEQLNRLRKYIADADNAVIGNDLEGVALVNIQKRIHLAYGPDYGLTLESEAGRGTCAKLRLPVLPEE